MDLYNLVTKIPYLIMLGIGLMIILNLYISGLNDLSVNIDTASNEEYREAIILENLLTKQAEDGPEYYGKRRAALPSEYLTNKDPAENEIGYKKSDGHCYIEGIPGLNGEDFAFEIQTMSDEYKNAESVEPLDCKTSLLPRDSIWSPALIIREGNPPVEVRIHVYKV